MRCRACLRRFPTLESVPGRLDGGGGLSAPRRVGRRGASGRRTPEPTLSVRALSAPTSQVNSLAVRPVQAGLAGIDRGHGGIPRWTPPLRNQQVLGSIPSAGSKPNNKLERFDARGIFAKSPLGCSWVAARRGCRVVPRPVVSRTVLGAPPRPDGAAEQLLRAPASSRLSCGGSPLARRGAAPLRSARLSRERPAERRATSEKRAQPPGAWFRHPGRDARGRR